ncbi:MAG: nuclear transport factor 2 family protein [Gemmatimonadota bacterium]|jgi:hypothetical protein
MSNRAVLSLVLAASLALGACAAGQRAEDGDALSREFEATLNRHLDAIRTRDLAGIEATITSGPELVLIFPNGHRTTTRDEYMDFHRNWFASDTWTMHIEVLDVEVGRDFAIAMTRTLYEDVADGERVQSRSWLTLTFRREGDRWALYHDQNTRIP